MRVKVNVKFKVYLPVRLQQLQQVQRDTASVGGTTSSSKVQCQWLCASDGPSHATGSVHSDCQWHAAVAAATGSASGSVSGPQPEVQVKVAPL